MGNKLARTTQASPAEYYLHDLPSSFNLVLKETLGNGRFLKSVQCVHDEGLLLVKVYFKRGEFVDLKENERRLHMIRERLKDIEHTHVWPFQHWFETDKAAYLLRQYFFSNLHDRINTRPFLSMIEKKWLAFQLLHALQQSHERGIYHGDIKCENVLVTSWNWVYLADYASYKPTYIPDDNPSDFSFFFDTGGARRCYIAPERFYDPANEQIPAVEAPLKPSMDVFSIGCVIAELFLEGQALFDLPQLLSYRKGQYDPRNPLEKVPDAAMRDMILHMIHLSPDCRLSATEYLQSWSHLVFPSYFSPVLHKFFSCLSVLDTDTRVAVTQGAFPELCEHMVADAKVEVSDQYKTDLKGVTASEGVITSPKKVIHKNEHTTIGGLDRGHSFKMIEKSDGEKKAGAIKESSFARSRSLPIASHEALVNDIGSLLVEHNLLSTRKIRDAGSRALSYSGSAEKSNFEMGIHSALKTSVKPSVYNEQPKIVTSSGIETATHLFSKNQPRMEPKLSRRVKVAAIAMAKGISEAQEPVVEEIYESEVRQADGTYSEEYFHARALSEPYGAAVPGRKKDEVSLPSEGGWEWEGDWEVDLEWANSDAQLDDEGWAYYNLSHTDMEAFKGDQVKVEEAVNVPSEGIKSVVSEKAMHRPGLRPYDLAVCSPTESFLRQRKWTRKRKKVARQPVFLSDSQILPSGGVALEDFGKLHEQSEETVPKCEGMVLIASLLCACLRNVRLPQARRSAVQLLHDASFHCEDDARLQHIVPFVAALLSDPAAIVRCAALQTLCNVLSSVKNVAPSDVKIFPEYILPLLSMLPDDAEESVRICYADCIHKFAATSYRFLVCPQTINNGFVDASHRTAVTGYAKHDLELGHLRENVARVIQELVMGPKQTPTIRQALLRHIGTLCNFFGQKQTNDFLLPILPAFLNDRDEQLRAVFFEYIINVCIFVGQMSSEAYLLPYIEQALSDVEEAVVVNALECLAALCVQNLLRKRVLLKAVEYASPLLCHPGQWVRHAAITFVAATGANLVPADAHAYLIPSLCPFLRREPVSLSSEAALLACLKPPVSREVFNRVLSDVMISQLSPETAPVRRPVQHGKIRQKVPLSQVSEVGFKEIRGSLEGAPIRDAKATVSNNKIVTKPWGDKGPQSQIFLSDHTKQLTFVSDSEDGEKMRAMEEYIRNLSSTMRTQKHNWEKENSEKLESSTVGLAAGVGAGFYSSHDGFSEGIPLYSIPVSDGQHEGLSWQISTAQSSPSFSEEWSRVFGDRQGTSTFYSGTPVLSRSLEAVASSQWNTVGQSDSVAQLRETVHRSHSTSPTLPRMAANSVHGGIPVGTKKVHEIRKDISYNESEQEKFSSSKSKILTSTNSNLHVQLLAGEATADPMPVSAALSGLLGMISEDSRANEGYWRPRGVLIAHLQEHQRAVNDLSVSSDNAFFASASDEGSVKIWDCRRLERDIAFRSRLTYSFSSGRALCVKMLAADHQVAAASSTGTIHIFSVDYAAHAGGSTDRYSGISNTKMLESNDGAVLCLQTFGSEGPPRILYSTQRNSIHLWDLRSQKDVWILRKSPKNGFVSAIAVDPSSNWFVSGTSKGVMTLWDLRFQIPVYSWQHPLRCFIETMTPLLPVSNSALSLPVRPLIYAAAGCNEISLWNAEAGSCHQILRYSADTPIADSTSKWVPNLESPDHIDAKEVKVPSPSNYKVDELQEPPAHLPGIRALLSLPGGTLMLSGGTDCRIRMWDFLRPDRSYCVCGPVVKAAKENLRFYDDKVVSGARIIQEVVGGEAGGSRSKISKDSLPAKAGGGCHRDSITCLALAHMSQPLLISCSRDGVIKVWK